MEIDKLQADYISVPEIARDAGVITKTVHNWLKYHRYMPFIYIFGKPVVRRDDYESFKSEHPELIKAAEVAQ